MLASVSESPSATTAPVSRRDDIDARHEVPIIGQAADRHDLCGGEISRRRDVVGLSRITPGDSEARRQIVRQVHADGEVRQRRERELDRIADDERADGDRGAGFTTERDPPAGAGTTAGPALRRPTQAAPIANGRVPYAFEMRTRSALPPMLTRGIMRSVWLANAAPSAGAGAAVQVPTQCVLSLIVPPYIVRAFSVACAGLLVVAPSRACAGGACTGRCWADPLGSA